MNGIIEHFISGNSYFTGLVLIAIAVILSFSEKRVSIPVKPKEDTPEKNSEKDDASTESKEQEQPAPAKRSIPILKYIVRLFMFLGVLLLLLSSTPISGPLYRITVISLSVIILPFSISL